MDGSLTLLFNYLLSDRKAMSPATSNIQSVQRWRKHVLRMLFVVFMAVVLFSQSLRLPGTPVHEALEMAGMAMIAVAVLGRTWSSLYIGGRKNAELVQFGPYSLMRNPLYTFSFIGAAGIGLQLGSALFGLAALVSHGVKLARCRESGGAPGAGGAYVCRCLAVRVGDTGRRTG